MSYDLNVPEVLKGTQQWFASIISRPIDDESAMNPISPRGVPMELEAPTYIAPSPTMQPAERIQIYNQQYWWRIVGALQDNFPLVTRLFGYYDFNQRIAVPFLTKYPPNHWSLSNLGDSLFQWVEEDYHEGDKELVLNSVLMDSAFTASFLAAQEPLIDFQSISTQEGMESLSSRLLVLQPHVFFIKLPYDLFQFRMDFMLQSADYWVDNDFPVLEHFDELKYYVLYRNALNQNEWIDISESEYILLRQFETGTTIDKICDFLAEAPQDSKLLIESSNELNVWIQRWIGKSWLTFG